MPLIQEQIVGVGGAPTITFSSIVATYRDLTVIVRGRGTKAATFVTVCLQFNGDTGANYDWQQAGANGVSANNTSTMADTKAVVGAISAASSPTDAADAAEIKIHDYRGTTFQKSLLSTSKFKTASTGTSVYWIAHSGWWRSTSAITSIVVFPDTGNFVQGSVISLYGSL